MFTLTQKCLPLLRAGAKEGGKQGATYLDPARIINVGYSYHFSRNCYIALIRDR